MNQFVSDAIDAKRIRPGVFNLIVSGCGTGKTYFVAKYLPDALNVEYRDVIFVTSRRAIVDQMDQQDGLDRFDRGDDINMARYWNGRAEAIRECKEKGMRVMTYTQFIYLIKYASDASLGSLEDAKVIIIDECHAMFSDTYMKDVFAMWKDIQMRIRLRQQIVIGMTATPNVIYEGGNRCGIELNYLLDKPLIRYKARKLWIVDDAYIPKLLTDKKTFPGKSIVMCNRITTLDKLSRSVPNAAALVSRSREKGRVVYTPEMDRLRDEILINETLPATYAVTEENGAHEYPLETLLTTTTFREGINLREKSGIRNVVCYHVDELSIIQFLGRCRFDVDNLIIVKTQRANHRLDVHKYESVAFNSFFDYLSGESTEWLERIAGVIEHEPGALPEAKRYPEDVGSEEFFKWFDRIYTRPGMEVKIYSDEDRQAILGKARECGIGSRWAPAIAGYKAMFAYIKGTGRYRVKEGRKQTPDGTPLYRQFFRNTDAA